YANYTGSMAYANYTGSMASANYTGSMGYANYTGNMACVHLKYITAPVGDALILDVPTAN
ncbi:hypothetical protein ACQP3D_29225, partial [Escherichia coli]